jgi:hypothetical protein
MASVVRRRSDGRKPEAFFDHQPVPAAQLLRQSADMFSNLLELSALATFGWFALLCAFVAESGWSLGGRKRAR